MMLVKGLNAVNLAILWLPIAAYAQEYKYELRRLRFLRWLEH